MTDTSADFISAEIKIDENFVDLEMTVKMLTIDRRPSLVVYVVVSDGKIKSKYNLPLR